MTYRQTIAAALITIALGILFAVTIAVMTHLPTASAPSHKFTDIGNDAASIGRSFA
jgi:hypothetical protein